MRNRFWRTLGGQGDLGLVLGLVVLADICSVTHQGPRWLGEALGFPLVLFLPGYAVVRALQPPQMDAAQRLIASIAISLAVAVLVGIGLNWLPGGIDTSSESASLSSVTVLAVVVAWLRRGGPGRGSPPAARGRRRVRIAGGSRAVLAGAAAIALTSTGLAIATQAAAHRQRLDSPTALWLSPDGARRGRLQVGVTSGDQGPAGYRLELVDGATVLERWSIVLRRGGTWSTSVDLPEARPGHRVQAMLYRLGGHRPIRHVAEAEIR